MMRTAFANMLVIIWLICCPGFSGAQPERAAGEPPNQEAPEVDISQMTDIHDIKPLARLHWQHRRWLVALAVVLVLAALAGAIYYIIKRHRKSRAPATLLVPPDQMATERLRDIADVRQFDGKTFYFRLSAIVRDYIEERFGLNAPDLTTEELLPLLRHLPLKPDLSQGLADLLRASEPIRYAQGIACADQMHQDWLFARRFVAESAPEIEAPEASAGTGALTLEPDS